MLLAYCKSRGIEVSNIHKPEYEQRIMYKYGFHDWDNVLAAIGHGGLKEGQIANRMNEMYEEDHKAEISDEDVAKQIAEASAKTTHAENKGHTSGIMVKGVHDASVLDFHSAPLTLDFRPDALKFYTHQNTSFALLF